MKMRVIQHRDKTFDLDGEFAEPAIREAIEDGCNDVASTIIDYTDTERGNLDPDEYVIVTEDDGTEKWRGWLGMGRKNIPAPDAALRDQLEALAGHWEREYVTDDGWPAICARQLREAIGAKP